MKPDRRFSILKLLFFKSMIAVATCSAAEETTPQFELLHLWAEQSEQHALAALSEPMKAAGVIWSEQIVKTNFHGVRETFGERLALDIPPTAVFWIGGGPAVAELIDRGIFTEIQPVTGQGAFANLLLPEVFEAISYGENISVLPVGIHLQNFMVYNKRILDEICATALPENWDAFVTYAQKAHEAGYAGLSFSDQSWQLRFLIGAIMIEFLDKDEMKILVTQGEIGDAQRSAIRAAFEILDRLRPYLNTDYRDLAWIDAVGQVSEGRAMANALGDFVAPVVSDQDDVICALPPGNKYVAWSFDAIALTKTDNPAELLGQKRFIEIVSDPRNATAYIARKGGIPVFRDFEKRSLMKCAKVSLDAWENSPGTVRLMTHEWTRAMSMISNFAKGHLNNPESDIDKTLDNLFAALAELPELVVVE